MKCDVCSTEMIDGFNIIQDNIAGGLKLAGRKVMTKGKAIKPMAAVCPACGKITLYVNSLENIENCMERSEENTH
ncbi:MAG: hypothetical protein K6D03_06060 [Solobacterium sp.]|nr:hypothetical protein [Solobacterium sp.]